MRDSELTLR
jgi:glycosidase